MTRKTMLWIAVLTMAAVIAVVLVVFQPQKLVIDKRVDEAAPAAALPVAAPAVSRAPAAMSDLAAPEPVSASAAAAPAAAPSASASPSGATSPAAAKAPAAPAATSAPAAAPAPAAVRGGDFRSLNHKASGTATLLQVEAGHVVRFENLNVENGPDLYVYLSPATSDSKAAAFDAGHLNLGKLKGNKGNQNYTVPAGVDLSKYKSVVVWCRRFSSGFAVAPIA